MCRGARGSTNTAPPPPKLVVGVDRRIELMSILFRLANRPRYAEAQTPYARAVDTTFDKTQATHVELPDGSEDIYVIAHLDHPDAAGVPAPTAAALPFVAHELCHSYTNPIVDGAEHELTTVAAPAIANETDKMTAQAYTTDAIVVQESIVRATVVLWLRERGGAAAGDAEIATQERLGFVWTRARRCAPART